MTKIIAFEGIDGTGKSVQMERLTERLTARGLFVATIAFPRYDSFFGAEVGKYLTGRDGVRADSVDGKSMALWFALDRFEAFRGYDYSAADVLLINRYVLSNAVYQSIRDCDIGRPDLLDFVLALEHEHFGIPRADAHIVLDMEPENAQKNVDKKGFRDYVGASERDVYEAETSLQARARARYRAYAERLPNVFIIGCMGKDGLLSIPEIGKKIDGVLEIIL